jgi:ABC-type transporter MlaC component
MARGRRKIADWMDDSTESWHGKIFGQSWSDGVAPSMTFQQLLTLLNSTQTEVHPRWADRNQHWQPNSRPDQEGALTVTSDSPDGFVTDATVTAHVSDPDGVRWRTVKFQWFVGDGDGNWTAIDGATSASLKLTSEFLGRQIDVTATYVDRKGHFSTVADPFPVTSPDTTPEPAPAKPDQPGHIELTPSTGVGENDVVAATVVDGDGVQTVSYQWRVRGADGQWQDIAGEDSATLTITSDLAGKDVEVLVSYIDGAQHSATLTRAFAVAPTPAPEPEPDQPGQLALSPNSGHASGVIVQAAVFDADGVDVTSEKFQWRVSQNGQWQDIVNATTDSLNLTDALAGKNVELVVTYDDEAGHSATLTRTFSVAPLPPPPPPPNLPGTVAISSPNGLNEGSTLTANASDADGFVSNGVSYAWQENVGGSWQNIGTGKTHTIGFAEGEHDIRVLASYTDNAGHAESPQSSAVSAVDVDRPGTLTVTSGGGGFAQGATVTAGLTDPDGVAPGSVHFQWSSKGGDGLWHAISGATAASYTLTAADAGKQIDVAANYLDLQGHDDTATANPFTVAAPPPAPSPSGGGGSGAGSGSGATLLWSQEFDTPLDLKSSSNPDGVWSPVNFWQSINSGGYEDYAGQNWNINPNHPAFAPYNPFSIENGYLQIESFRTPAELVAPIQQQMTNQGIPGPVPEWSGGMLVTNKDEIEFTYGYFEFRARFVDEGKGMFPAMWFYSARGGADPQGKGSAEIDLFEMFGKPNEWYTATHPGGGVGSETDDTSEWHTYGMLWESDLLQFYRDEELLYSVTGPEASYFNNVPMAIRVNFAMDAPWFDASRHSDSSTPSSMYMQIDYIRQYAELPFLTGTG